MLGPAEPLAEYTTLKVLSTFIQVGMLYIPIFIDLK